MPRVELFLSGDVMTGRGIDQILPHPSMPRLYEDHIRDARDYVLLSERENGAFERPVGFDYVWGDALDELRARAPNARIVNLETSVTKSDMPWPKGINYRMHPENVPCLTIPEIDVCVLANNHVLDWGANGLVETLDVLRRADVKTVGAGRSIEEAARVAIVDVDDQRRVLVVAVADASSGAPPAWEAGRDAAGIARLHRVDDVDADIVASRIERVRRPGDIAVASIHWGSNWGYEVPREHVQFAHALIDRGIDVVHGHSSHHPRGIELYRDKPIFYGCGDLLTDYEGIRGFEPYRADLVLMYFVRFEGDAFASIRMTPLRIRRMRLERASPQDGASMMGALERASRPFGTKVTVATGGAIAVDGRTACYHEA
jgi:poly-gamma-glutamate capsule biosynthesis protein CapA/YwtB (metallophosphatase superfamily)